MPLALPVVPPSQNALMPTWVAAYANAVNLMANATVAYQAQPPYGSGAFTFGGNCILTLRMNLIPTMNPAQLYNGPVLLAKIATATGSLTVQNGVITAYTAPT